MAATEGRQRDASLRELTGSVAWTLAGCCANAVVLEMMVRCVVRALSPAVPSFPLRRLSSSRPPRSAHALRPTPAPIHSLGGSENRTCAHGTQRDAAHHDARRAGAVCVHGGCERAQTHPMASAGRNAVAVGPATRVHRAAAPLARRRRPLLCNVPHDQRRVPLPRQHARADRHAVRVAVHQHALWRALLWSPVCG